MLILKGSKRPVISVAFSPDGTLLASGASEGCVRVWNALDGKPVAVLPQVDEGHHSSTELTVLFAPDRRHLVVASGEYNLTVWDVVERRQVKALLPEVPYLISHSVGFAADGRLLALLSHEDEEGAAIYAWSSATWEQLSRVYEHHDEDEDDRGSVMALEPGGRRAVLDTGVLLDTVSGKVLGNWREPLDGYWVNGNWNLAWCPRRPYVACRIGPNRFEVIDVEDSKVVTTVTTTTKKHLEAFTFTPDGNHLIAVSNDRVARFYDVGTWQERQSLDFGIGGLRSVAVAADGSRAAAGSNVSTYSGKIVIWDLA